MDTPGAPQIEDSPCSDGILADRYRLQYVGKTATGGTSPSRAKASSVLQDLTVKPKIEWACKCREMFQAADTFAQSHNV